MKSRSRESSELSIEGGRKPTTRPQSDWVCTRRGTIQYQKRCSAFALTGFGEVGPPPQVATQVALGRSIWLVNSAS
jgi:hypothetical protein